MTVKPIPEGYHSVTPYLIVGGIASLIEFMKQAFGGEESQRLQRPDGTIMHAEVRIGDSIIMMGEPTTEFTPMPASLHLYVEDTDAVYQQALKAGAISIQEPEDQFYGDRSAGVKDASGNFWWLATHIKDVSIEELSGQAGGGQSS